MTFFLMVIQKFKSLPNGFSNLKAFAHNNLDVNSDKTCLS